MSLKTSREKYDEDFPSKHKLEREISLLKKSTEERNGTIELIQKEVIEYKYTS